MLDVRSVNMLESCCYELLGVFVNIEMATHKQQIEDSDNERQLIAQPLSPREGHGEGNAHRLSNLQ